MSDALQMDLGLYGGMVSEPEPKIKKARLFSATKAWHKARKECLRLHQYCCYKCGKDARDVHHIKPRALFPHMALIQSNLIPLCKECHDGIHGKSRG